MFKFAQILGLFLCISAHAEVDLTEGFELSASGPFKRLKVQGAMIESEWGRLSYVGADAGRPSHFGLKSLYSDGALTIILDTPAKGTTIDVQAWRGGKPTWTCDLVDMQGNPSLSKISDIFAEPLIHPQWGPLWALPLNYKVTKCIVKSNSGMILDNLVIQQ